jgi:hypothetical protein
LINVVWIYEEGEKNNKIYTEYLLHDFLINLFFICKTNNDIAMLSSTIPSSMALNDRAETVKVTAATLLYSTPLLFKQSPLACLAVTNLFAIMPEVSSKIKLN